MHNHDRNWHTKYIEMCIFITNVLDLNLKLQIQKRGFKLKSFENTAGVKISQRHFGILWTSSLVFNLASKSSVIIWRSVDSLRKVPWHRHIFWIDWKFLLVMQLRNCTKTEERRCRSRPLQRKSIIAANVILKQCDLVQYRCYNRKAHHLLKNKMTSTFYM